MSGDKLGWQIVPIEPTTEMAFAAHGPFFACFDSEKVKLMPNRDRRVLALKAAYKAMLASAPKPSPEAAVAGFRQMNIVAATAYLTHSRIKDPRTGVVYNFERRSG